MRVIITKFPHNSLLGGGELHTCDVVEGLLSLGVDFVLLSSDDVLIGEFKKKNWKFKKIWAPLEPVSLRGLLLFPFFALPFFWYLAYWLFVLRKEHSVVYCLSYTEKILITPWARLLGMRVVWMEHLRIERSYLLNPLRPLYVICSRCATVVAVSKGVGDQLRRLGVSQSNIEVIPNGVDVDRFSGVARPQKSDNAALTIGTLSRLVPEKSIITLIEAVELLAQKGIDVRCVIGGDGPSKTDLEAYVTNKGLTKYVTFVGFVSKPEVFLSECDIFAIASCAKESFGYAVVEAMASGLPVVATDITGFNEVVVDDKTGFLCPIGDAYCFAHMLEKLITSPDMRNSFGEVGRARARRYFSKNEMIKRYKHMFERR